MMNALFIDLCGFYRKRVIQWQLGTDVFLLVNILLFL